MKSSRPELRPSIRLATVCIDCADADAMADFNGRLLDWETTAQEPGWVLMRDPAGGTGLSFQAEANDQPPVWPEQPDGQDKVLHLDIKVDDFDSAVDHALSAGAVLAEHQPRARVRVYFDPAGNPSACSWTDRTGRAGRGGGSQLQDQRHHVGRCVARV